MSVMLSRRQALATGAMAVAGSLLAGCGSSASDGSATSGDEEGRKLKVAIVISGPTNDGGWGQGHFESLKRALESHPNWEMLEPKDNTADADAAAAAQSYADQDVDLIVGAGNEFASVWADVVAEAAEDHPKVHFLITNTDPKIDLADYQTLDNLETVLTSLKQSGALAGVVAGLMTKTNSIGFIGGAKLPTTLTKYAAYLAAAQKVTPGVEGHYNFEAGFSDASLGAKLTESWINTNNVDVMWGDASAVDNGARQALESAGADTHFNIAQPIDSVGDEKPCVITSTIIDWKIDQAMDEIEAGSFGGGKVISADMSNGGISLGAFSDKVSADVQGKIKEYAEQIKNDAFLTDAEVEAIRSTL